MKNACTVVLFLFFRLQWHLAVEAITLLGHARDRGIWVPRWVFGVVGSILGMSWAFRGMRFCGLHPDMMSKT